jgi:hypothetical protein
MLIVIHNRADFHQDERLAHGYFPLFESIMIAKSTGPLSINESRVSILHFHTFDMYLFLETGDMQDETEHKVDL